jgi:hypothetical protein
MNNNNSHNDNNEEIQISESKNYVKLKKKIKLKKPFVITLVCVVTVLTGAGFFAYNSAKNATSSSVTAQTIQPAVSETSVTSAEITSGQNATAAPHIHLFSEWEMLREATCTEDGERTRNCECGERESEKILSVGHKKEIIKGKPSTCTEAGLTEGEKCRVCGEILAAQEEIPPSHTIVTKTGYPATKTENGLTDGRHCEACGEVLEEQKVIFATGSLGLAYAVLSDSTCSVIDIGACTDKDVIIPDYIDGYEVVAIDVNAFAGNSDIISLRIPNGVHDILEDSFGYCPNLQSITVAENNTKLKSENGVLYSADGKKLICYPAGRTESEFVIPESVTDIERGAFFHAEHLKSVTIPAISTINGQAFSGCTALESVSIADGVQHIFDWAFFGCSSLTKIEIPDSVRYISHYAFAECTALESIKLPAKLESIENNTFENCVKLKSVEIPDGVLSIGENAFKGCTGLESVRLPEGLKSIGYTSFGNCDSLTEIAVPKTVTDIGGWAFVACDKLEKITVEAGNKNYVSYEGVLYSADGKTLICYPAGKTDASYTVMNGVETIGDAAFSSSPYLTSVNIPQSVKIIGQQGFYRCTGLESIELPNGITSIGSYCFYECRALRFIKVPEGVTTIGMAAFDECTALESIELPASLTNIDAYAFDGCKKITAVIYAGTVSKWGNIAKNSNWNRGTGEYTVYCADGRITKDGAITYA